jgi:hypothetical protein
MQFIWSFIRRSWDFFFALSGLVGVLYLAQDVEDLPEALKKLRALVPIDRETALITLSALLVLYIGWMDIRPSIYSWLERKRKDVKVKPLAFEFGVDNLWGDTEFVEGGRYSEQLVSVHNNTEHTIENAAVTIVTFTQKGKLINVPLGIKLIERHTGKTTCDIDPKTTAIFSLSKWGTISHDDKSENIFIYAPGTKDDMHRLKPGAYSFKLRASGRNETPDEAEYYVQWDESGNSFKKL